MAHKTKKIQKRTIQQQINDKQQNNENTIKHIKRNISLEYVLGTP
jgi:hypothetical protein